MSRRVLAWDGYPNARDLGGLPTALSATGETVWGRVVRGPRRELLTARGWEQARGHGVRSVVDLRNADELTPRDGDPHVPAEAWRDVTVVRTPTEDQSDPEFARVCLPILDSPEYWAHNLRLQPALVASALRAVADAGPGAVLVHCAAGRDRTGMVSALLLAHAGVPAEVVADDYEISVRDVAGVAAHTATAAQQEALTPAQLDAFVARARGFVVALVDDVAGPDGVLERLGLTREERAALRARLLP